MMRFGRVGTGFLGADRSHNGVQTAQKIEVDFGIVFGRIFVGFWDDFWHAFGLISDDFGYGQWS